MAKLKIGSTIGEHLIATKEDLSNLQDNFSGSYNDLTDKPLTFIPSEHNHNIKDVIGLQNMIDSKVAISELQEHNSDITTETGKHGIRYFNDKLSIKSNGEWIDFEASGGDSGLKFPVGKVEDSSVTSGNNSITLTWKEPTDFYINDLLMATWAGTRVLRKTGSYPVDENDGVLVVNNSVRNQYAENGFEDTGLTNGITYYYSLFTYTTDGIFGEKVDIEAEAGVSFVYGVKIDTLNSNSETALIYTDDAIGFTSAKGNNGAFNYGSWEDKFPFNQIKPCLLKDGKVNYYLNPNDYTQKADGSPSDITSGADGDVMVEFPKIYWKFETIGTDLYIRYSNAKVDEGYKCLAHMRGIEERDKIYISAYSTSILASSLRSLSGIKSLINTTLSSFRDYAKENGEGYELFTYYQFLMLQVLFIVMFKNLNSQTALGNDYTQTTNKAPISSGNGDSLGLFYGTNDYSSVVKFCGIENLWGNLEIFIDGVRSDSEYNLLISNENFNDDANNYDNLGKISSVSLSGYISNVDGSTETGFIPTKTNASTSTYFCDTVYYRNDGYGAVGNYWNAGDGAGIFYIAITRYRDSSGTGLSSRMSYY